MQGAEHNVSENESFLKFVNIRYEQLSILQINKTKSLLSKNIKIHSNYWQIRKAYNEQ